MKSVPAVPGPRIFITLRGPQGSGKTQIKWAIIRYFQRARQRGTLPATRLSFREVQAKPAKKGTKKR